MAARRWRAGRLVAAFLAYLGISIASTWPLVTRFSTDVIGTNVDEGAFLWNLWWLKFSLFDLHQSPLFTDYLFYPQGVNLATYTLSPLNALLTLPVQLLLGPIVANNIVVIASLAFTGFGGYLLALQLLDSAFRESDRPEIQRGRFQQLAAFIGGAVMAFPSSRFEYATLGQVNFVSTAWVPFIALFELRMFSALREGRFRRSLLYASAAGACIAASVLTDLTYAVYALLMTIVLGVSGTYSLSHSRRASIPRVEESPAGITSAGSATSKAGSALRRLLFGGLVLGAVAVVPVLPIAVPFASDRTVAQSGWGEADRFSIDLVNLVTPTLQQQIYGDLPKVWSRDFRDRPVLFLGWFGGLAAVAAAAVAFRKAKTWIALGLTSLVLSFGPILHVGGKNSFDLDGIVVRFPMPFLFLHYVPFLGANRVPNRFSILVSVALGVLIAFGMSYLSAGLFRLRVFGSLIVILNFFVLAVLLFEQTSVPLPIRTAVAPSPYYALAKIPGDFSVLQLPLGWRNSFGTQGIERTILQSYQSVHHKRLLGGNTSRNPAIAFDYFKRVPFIRTIIAMEEGKPFENDAARNDPSLAAGVVELFNLRYVAMQRSITPSVVQEYTQSMLRLNPVEDDGDTVLFEIQRPPAPEKQHLEIGAASGDAFLSAGWGENELAAGDVTLVWGNQKHAEIVVPGTGGVATVRFRLLPFTYPDMPPQKVTIAAGGRQVSTQTLVPDWNVIELKLPLAAGANKLALDFDNSASPSDVLKTSDRRQLTAALDWIDICPAQGC